MTSDSDDPSKLTVHTTQPADKGHANEAILKLIAEHLDVSLNRLTLVSGQTARVKLVDVEE